MGDPGGHLGPLLKQVSRSFSLTLRILPGPLRGPLGLAYLLARAADSVADTRILPRSERLRCLDLFREELDLPPRARLPEIRQALAGSPQVSAERELLARLPECFAAYGAVPGEDRRRIRTLLLTLTHGMQQELRRFPGEDEGRLVALDSRADLDRHTYYAAGCVGAFWTEMAMAHCPALRHWDGTVMAQKGIHFGQGLQMTNVLRDLAHDLRIGRCFLPRPDLAAQGLRPEDLLDPATLDRLRPLLLELIAYTLSLFGDGWAYTLSIPRRLIRLRLACAWPLLIGLQTLQRLQQARDLLDPRSRVKIPRSAVYRIIARSAAVSWSDAGLDGYYRRLRGRIGGVGTAAEGGAPAPPPWPHDGMPASTG